MPFKCPFQVSRTQTINNVVQRFLFCDSDSRPWCAGLLQLDPYHQLVSIPSWNTAAWQSQMEVLSSLGW
jgi:hypothetical protein